MSDTPSSKDTSVTLKICNDSWCGIDVIGGHRRVIVALAGRRIVDPMNPDLLIELVRKIDPAADSATVGITEITDATSGRPLTAVLGNRTITVDPARRSLGIMDNPPEFPGENVTGYLTDPETVQAFAAVLAVLNHRR